MRAIHLFLYEWKHFIRNPFKVIAVLLFTLATAYGLHNGASLYEKQSQEIQNIQNKIKEDRETYSENYIKDDGLGLDYFGEQKPQLFKELPSEYAVIVAGAAHPTKKIPEELLAKIQEKSKLPCIILGAKSDDNVAFNSMQNVVNLCGKTNLHESAYVVKSANHVYSSDTGLMHIAAAFQKEITVFWGNTVPEFGMYPFRTPHINKEVGGLSCRPCSKIGFPECPKGQFKCMMDQEG